MIRHSASNFSAVGFAALAILAALWASPASALTAQARAQVMHGSDCKSTAANADVRFDANGTRNDSADTGAFVICPLMLQYADSEFPPIKGLAAVFFSLDGAAHDISCTAVVGAANRTPLRYSTRTVRTLPSTTNHAKIQWFTGDFGGDPDVPRPIPGSAFVTVTCNLPPKTLLNYLIAGYRLDFGA